MKIIIGTVLKTLRRSDIAVGSEYKAGRFLEERKDWIIKENGAIKPK